MRRTQGRLGALVGVLVLGAVGFAAVAQFGSLSPALEVTESDIPAPPTGAVEMTVEHVHDGDTLFLRADEPNALVATTDVVKVRLLGIDTPEVGDRAECFGDQAADQLRTLLPDGSRTWVTADLDPTDQYGRNLFYLWTEDGRFVNHELVAGGAAESLMIAPNDAYYPLLRAAEDAATTAGAGRWGAC